MYRYTRPIRRFWPTDTQNHIFYSIAHFADFRSLVLKRVFIMQRFKIVIDDRILDLVRNDVWNSRWSLLFLIFIVGPTSHSMTRLKMTWPALYHTSILFSLKGFRLAITLGPRYVTIYKYVMTMISVGNGLSINGQSFTRGSVLKTKTIFFCNKKLLLDLKIK